MKKIIFFLTLAILLNSCIQEVKFSKLNKEQLLQPGEWFDVKDSLSGISIREDKMAFIKTMKFSSDDICHYSIIDSVKKAGQNETIIGEYLILKGYTDTIQYEITKREDSVLSLKINNDVHEYKLKKFIAFRDK
jgi:hypothetical protein